MQTILVSPHVNAFYITYDPASDMDTLLIDGVKVSVDLLRAIIVDPKYHEPIRVKRDADVVTVERLYPQFPLPRS